MSKRGKNFLSNLFSSSSPSSSSSSRTTSQPQPPPPSLPPPPPAAFFCPISTLLMANPVVIPSGHSVDRPCIQACRDLNFTPPHLNLTIPPSSSSFVLTPNIALFEAILHWCDLSGHPLPSPISPASALHFVRALMWAPSLPPLPHPPPYSFDLDRETRILKKLSGPRSQEALQSLIQTPLCSPRILAALLPLLSSPHGDDDPELQNLAAQSIRAFSLGPSNRAQIVRSSAIPPLIAVLATGAPGAAAAAAQAFHQLSSDRTVIGALGAIPPLLDRFCGPFSGRAEAARALHGLLGCRENAAVAVENGGVGRLMEVAASDGERGETRRHALRLVTRLMGVKRGREEGMEGLVRMAWEGGGGVGLGSVGAMYRACREDLRGFREAAGRAGGEGALAEEREEWGPVGRKMAKAMVRVIRGEVREREEMEELEVEMEEEEEEERKKKGGRRWKEKIAKRFRKMGGGRKLEYKKLEESGGGGGEEEKRVVEEEVVESEKTEEEEESGDEEDTMMEELLRHGVRRLGRRLEMIAEDEEEED